MVHDERDHRQGRTEPRFPRNPREESGPEHIRTILKTVFRDSGLEDQLRENRAVLCWEDVAGPELARVTRGSYVEKGTLWVEVNNSVRMHSLQMQETDLRTRLNLALKQSGSTAGAVRQIRFRLMEND
jgi:predicted nucleic acid-binding Zn ribbon protein